MPYNFLSHYFTLRYSEIVFPKAQISIFHGDVGSNPAPAKTFLCQLLMGMVSNAVSYF